MKRVRRSSFWLIILMVTVVIAGCFGGPKVGDVSGQVTDREGVPIAGAAITVGSETTETDDEGMFSFKELKHGAYTLTVIINGETITIRDIRISASPLWVPIVHDEDMQFNLIDNFDFSQGVDADGLPVGWTSFARNPEEGNDFMVTDERSFIGEYSLKNIDGSNERGVGVRSGDYPVEVGDLYRAEVDVFVESGSAQIFMDFRNESLVRVLSKSATVGTDADWQRLTVELEVPEGAVNVSLILYGSVGNVGVAYFDNVLLYKVEE